MFYGFMFNILRIFRGWTRLQRRCPRLPRSHEAKGERGNQETSEESQVASSAQLKIFKKIKKSHIYALLHQSMVLV